MKSHAGSTVFAAIVLAAALSCAWPIPSRADTSIDVGMGRTLYMQKGCYECHGIFGQGSVTTGPALAPNPLPLPAMEAYVHNPEGQMPIFSERILSNDEISHIHAYLASLPPNRPVENIALLNGNAASASAYDSSSSVSRNITPLAHGASIYAAHCAACHGQSGEGAVGPTLIGISGRFQTADIEARIREPSGIMPRLFPTPLNAEDVRDVARYVASLDSHASPH
jgi:ubiquinol-cytochrome c reductase cytochrome c subunit